MLEIFAEAKGLAATSERLDTQNAGDYFPRVDIKRCSFGHLAKKEDHMLVRRVWPSRPTFDSPPSDLEEVRRGMLRLFDTVSGDALGVVGAGVFPPINITQDDDHFYLRTEVPGMKPNELSISVVRNRVSLAGRREIPREHERASYHRKERAEGSFNRTVTLPTDVVADRVDAAYANGILTLTLPKAEEAKPRQIPVRS